MHGAGVCSATVAVRDRLSVASRSSSQSCSISSSVLSTPRSAFASLHSQQASPSSTLPSSAGSLLAGSVRRPRQGYTAFSTLLHRNSRAHRGLWDDEPVRHWLADAALDDGADRWDAGIEQDSPTEDSGLSVPLQHALLTPRQELRMHLASCGALVQRLFQSMNWDGGSAADPSEPSADGLPQHLGLRQLGAMLAGHASYSDQDMLAFVLCGATRGGRPGSDALGAFEILQRALVSIRIAPVCEYSLHPFVEPPRAVGISRVLSHIEAELLRGSLCSPDGHVDALELALFLRQVPLGSLRAASFW